MKESYVCAFIPCEIYKETVWILPLYTLRRIIIVNPDKNELIVHQPRTSVICETGDQSWIGLLYNTNDVRSFRSDNGVKSLI